MEKGSPTAHLCVVELEDELDMFSSFGVSLLPVFFAHVFLVQVLEDAEPSAPRRAYQQ